MVEEIWSTIDAIRDLNGAPFDIHDDLQRLSLNIVFRLTYGLRFSREVKPAMVTTSSFGAVTGPGVAWRSAGLIRSTTRRR